MQTGKAPGQSSRKDWVQVRIPLVERQHPPQAREGRRAMSFQNLEAILKTEGKMELAGHLTESWQTWSCNEQDSIKRHGKGAEFPRVLRVYEEWIFMERYLTNRWNLDLDVGCKFNIHRYLPREKYFYSKWNRFNHQGVSTKQYEYPHSVTREQTMSAQLTLLRLSYRL